MMKKTADRHIIANILIFLCVAMGSLYLLITPTATKYRSSSTAEELADTDLSKDFIVISSYNSEGYIGRLYESADFLNGTPEAGDSDAKYITYRLILKLKPGVTYGMTGESAAYAQKIYVNGLLLNETGTVSDNAADFVPRTDRFTVYFTPENEETEIIFQLAWFNHKSGALHKVYLAEQTVITRINRTQTLCDGLFMGMLLAMCLFFFGMFLVSRGNFAMLWFSLSCLCAVLNYAIYESKQIMTLIPDMSWYLGHKLEALSGIYYVFFIWLYAFTILKIRPKKWFAVPALSLVGAVSLFYIIAPSTFYTKYTVTAWILIFLCALGACIYLLVSEIRRHRLKNADDCIVCISMLIGQGVYLVEGITYFNHVLYLRTYLMIIFSFCSAIILVLNNIRTERALDEANTLAKETDAENAMLARMNNLKTGFMRNIAHEIKTPLTVMSGYAQLTEKQIERNMVDEETTANLEMIASEADRLSEMVKHLLDVTYGDFATNKMTSFSPDLLLKDAASVCRPILLKNNNQLTTDCRSSKMTYANREALLQVLINLSVNAGRHTKEGKITFSAEDAEDDNLLLFSVSDTGDGIRPDILPHVFERGYSTDGSSGLGLAICREIIESTGGSIYVKETGSSGTTICFTVPAAKEETE